MTGSLADADDVAQDTFIQAFRRLEDFRGDAKFSTWLYRIAMNISLNWKKRVTRRDRLHQDWAEQEAIFGGECAAMPPTDAENTHRVQKALDQLPPKQRAAIVLTVYDGMTHAEAAQALGCSETTVSWRVFVARAKLKRRLKTKPGND